MTPIKLPPVQPDCCAMCPLCGVQPPYVVRPRNSKKTHVCLGTRHALSGRGLWVRASERDARHPLHRPCDMLWEAWLQAPGQCFAVPDRVYVECRLPYEREQPFTVIFD